MHSRIDHIYAGKHCNDTLAAADVVIAPLTAALSAPLTAASSHPLNSRYPQPQLRTVFPCTRRIADNIATLRSRMHGRRRTDWRRQLLQRLALLEDMRAAQQYKSLFRRIGLKERTAIPLDTLSTSTARSLTLLLSTWCSQSTSSTGIVRLR